MKAVILAGGFGTRISEETNLKPKPMVEIGERPILWHIMKIFARHGVNEFIICLGYKGYCIKEYFYNYMLHQSDVTLDFSNNSVEFHQASRDPWKVTLVDTGLRTMTGGRLKRVAHLLGQEDFCFTYGDGLSDLNVSALIAYHRKHGKLATVTTVKPPSPFGNVELAGEQVTSFREKPQDCGSWINGGFFVLNPAAIGYVRDDQTLWEHEPLENLARDGQLMAFRHPGFWYGMDSLRDKKHLERLWDQGEAPWMRGE